MLVVGTLFATLPPWHTHALCYYSLANKVYMLERARNARSGAARHKSSISLGVRDGWQISVSKCTT